MPRCCRAICARSTLAGREGHPLNAPASPPPALLLSPVGRDDDAPRRLAAPWHARLLDAISAYLPLLLMALLALGTWWLVKNTPLFEAGKAAAPLRHDPDYTMEQFMVQRFAADGRLRVQIEGDVLRHYPDTDVIEVEQPRIRAFAPDGRVTVATARRAVSNGDGSEVQLSGGAHVVCEPAAGVEAIDFRGEFLHVFVNTERVRSHLPVAVTQGKTELRADALAYAHLARVIDLTGRVRATFVPQARKRP